MNGHDVDTSANAGAIAAGRKKLMGYVGFANLPNQVHRKSVRKGFTFTAMVVGESGLGKSTLINTLFNTTLYPRKEVPPPHQERPKTVAIESISSGRYQTLQHGSCSRMLPTRMLTSLPFAAFLLAAITDIEENGVRLRLNVVDTPGFGDYINNDER